VPCRVWRDVESEGTVFIKSGTVASCQVDKLKHRNMGGAEAKLSIAGMDTRSADGQQVMLSGGYDKEGSGRKAVVWTVGLLLLWPVLFVPGGKADLPPGTVFDVTTVSDLRMSVAAPPGESMPSINLTGLGGNALSAEILLDDLMAQKKPEILRIRVSKEGALPASISVDSINGKQVDPIPLKITKPLEGDGATEAVCEAQLKALAKHFQKGINRFELAYLDGGTRQATEVILDVQM
jgi:hypothetical protein